ncbi:OmpA family protein [Chitinophaga rhizosphaerae]|uniref:OmpA family protein n=1 Tax=Chitinophaga rhizosphaerae TaxID=1864947 RepID=UPI000F809E89|nr:OmpA family protein [Chitinophaga rhizosphaerae]
MRFTLLIALAIPACISASGQNLVVNGNLESVNICEVQSPCAPAGWYTSFDIDWAYQRIKHLSRGNGAHCIFLYAGPDKFVYWQSELIFPLEAGQTYTLEYYVGLSDAGSSVNDISFAFAGQREHMLGTGPRTLRPPAAAKMTVGRREKGGWTKISVRFEAAGNERWLILGAPGKGEAAPVASNPIFAVDDVSLTPAGKIRLTPEELQTRARALTSNRLRHELRPRKNAPADTPVIAAAPPPDTIRIPDIYFSTDSFRIEKPGDFQVLRETAARIVAKGYKAVIVNGYADITGSQQHNLVLSGKRAASIREYLIQCGIDQQKISAAAMGADTAAAAELSKGRRVDIVVVPLADGD